MKKKEEKTKNTPTKPDESKKRDLIFSDSDASGSSDSSVSTKSSTHSASVKSRSSRKNRRKSRSKSRTPVRSSLRPKKKSKSPQRPMDDSRTTKPFSYGRQVLELSNDMDEGDVKWDEDLTFPTLQSYESQNGSKERPFVIPVNFTNPFANREFNIQFVPQLTIPGQPVRHRPAIHIRLFCPVKDLNEVRALVFEYFVG